MQEFEEPENLQDFSPKDIAQTIFRNEPLDPNSCRIVSDDDDQDLIYIFEILLTIFLEGFDILTGGLDKIKLDDFSENHVNMMKPWFQSLGFNIKSSEYDIQDKDMYNEYYCKIILRSPETETFFIMQKLKFTLWDLVPHTDSEEEIARQIDEENLENLENYHFLINGEYQQQNREKKYLKDLYAVFLTKTKAFTIKFDFNYN